MNHKKELLRRLWVPLRVPFSGSLKGSFEGSFRGCFEGPGTHIVYTLA